MKAQEFLPEIGRIYSIDYEGGKDDIEAAAKSTSGLKRLPGGSGLLYNITGDKSEPLIVIWDQTGPDAQPGRPQPIGKLRLENIERLVPLPGALRVSSITVDEDYQGRGIAKAMYGIVLSIMRRPLVAGDSQTPGGRRNWVSLAQIPGSEVRGWVSIDDSDLTRRSKGQTGSNIDTLMGKLGADYIGKNRFNQQIFSFDVLPGQGEREMQAAVDTALSRVYDEHSLVQTGLYAVWTGA